MTGHQMAEWAMVYIPDMIKWIVSYIYAILIYGITLKRKYSKKRTALVWFLIAVVMTVGNQYIAVGKEVLYQDHATFFDKQHFIISSLVNQYFPSFILQVLLMFLGAVLLYSDGLQIKLFVSFMCYMYFSLVYDFFIPIVLAVCSRGVTDDGLYLLYSSTHYFKGMATDILATALIGYLLYIFYKRRLHRYFCEIREMAGQNGRLFVLIPIITYILYSFYVSNTDDLGLDFAYSQNLHHYIMMMGIMFFMMLLMYVFAFYGIMMRLRNANIAAELSIASKIQLDALPDLIEGQEFELAAMMEPAKLVGGDFYDFFMIDDMHLALGISDVSGKGISAALFMMESKAAIKSCAMWDAGAAIALTNANRLLCENNKERMFVTSFLAVFDLETRELTFANAGHNYPLLYHNGRWEWLKAKPKLFLAAMNRIKYEEHSVLLQPGDMLLLYTDGLTEAMNQDNQQYGNDRLEHFLNTHQEDNVNELINILYSDIKEFVKNAEPSDDITMLLMKVISPKGSAEQTNTNN